MEPFAVFWHINNKHECHHEKFVNYEKFENKYVQKRITMWNR